MDRDFRRRRIKVKRGGIFEDREGRRTRHTGFDKGGCGGSPEDPGLRSFSGTPVSKTRSEKTSVKTLDTDEVRPEDGPGRRDSWLSSRVLGLPLLVVLRCLVCSVEEYEE